MSNAAERTDAAFSSRRSFSRCRALVKLDDASRPMLANELARACGWDTTRLHDVLYGDGEGFSVERAPITLGQVRVVETALGEAFDLTDAGRQEVRALRREAFWACGGRRPHR